MINVEQLFTTDGFMPHGMCFMWRPSILAVHVGADSLIALAYFTIPFTLLNFVRKRADLRFAWIFLCFAAFIVACGICHLMEIWTIWYPMYWLSGGVKVVTSILSVMTAVLLAKLVPVALRLPSPAALQASNDDLARQVLERKRAEDSVAALNVVLETRVAERTSELEATNSELQRRVAARTLELRERESLLEEIHHRVKNNLQVVSSLINMQIRGLADESSCTALRDCQSRVATMSQIHDMLYQSADYARMPFAKYAKELTTRILRASGISPGRVTLDFALEEVPLPVEQAIPCGLILNELVSNSLKHAFPDARKGTIFVELRRAPSGSVLLAVRDDGVGVSPTFEADASSTLGTQLVATLVEQIAGHLDIIRESGTAHRITFPLDSTP